MTIFIIKEHMLCMFNECGRVRKRVQMFCIHLAVIIAEPRVGGCIHTYTECKNERCTLYNRRKLHVA